MTALPLRGGPSTVPRERPPTREPGDATPPYALPEHILGYALAFRLTLIGVTPAAIPIVHAGEDPAEPGHRNVANTIVRPPTSRRAKRSSRAVPTGGCLWAAAAALGRAGSATLLLRADRSQRGCKHYDRRASAPAPKPSCVRRRRQRCPDSSSTAGESPAALAIPERAERGFVPFRECERQSSTTTRSSARSWSSAVWSSV